MLPQRYASPVPAKVKRSVTLDADLVALVGEANLSARLNELLRAQAEREEHFRALRDYLDRVAAVEGQLDSPADLQSMRDIGEALGASEEELQAAGLPGIVIADGTADDAAAAHRPAA